MNCSSCGADLPTGARYCPVCGAAQSFAPDERRLVTVLMADIVGYTTMSEDADPEHVKLLVDRCFQRLVEVVQEFGGTLDKIVGDQLVAAFGAIQAHEDDAERAVRAALSMRDTLDAATADLDDRVRLRIGVNTGEVLVGALRAGGDATVTGDVVNTASRLQTGAEPGTIVVGATTHAATSSAISYRSLGPIEVRGRKEPVEAWEASHAIGPPGRRTRASSIAPLIGRGPEMRALESALQYSVARGTSSLVVLSGEAGVGKARLLAELCERAARRHQVKVLGGHCAPYGEPNPWAPVAEAIRAELCLDRDASDAEAVNAVRARVAGDAADQAERTVEALSGVLGVDPSEQIDPTRAREEQGRGIVTFIESMLDDGPLLLALSDVHWAQSELSELIVHLVRHLRRRPLIVVVTTRAEPDERFTPSPATNLLTFQVGPLDEAATLQLADHLLNRSIDADLGALVHERTGGNPLFVEELTAVLEGETGTDAPSSLRERLGSLPATLRGLVAARLDAMPEQMRSLLDDFAVVGTSGPTAAALFPSGRDANDPLVRELDSDGLLSVEGVTFRFKSEMIRDVAYQTLSKAERARRHAAVLDWLEGSGDTSSRELAHHAYEAAALSTGLGEISGLPADLPARALSYLETAAKSAEKVDAHRAAREHWDRVLALLDTTDEARVRRARLGVVRADEGRHDLDAAHLGALELLDEARGAGDLRSEAEAEAILGRIFTHRNDLASAEKHLGRARQVLQELGDERAVADVLRQNGQALLFAGELAGAEAMISEALAAFRRLDDARGEAWALQNLAWIAFVRADAIEAEKRLELSVELFERVGDWGGLSWALGLMAFVRFSRGRLEEAEHLGERILDEARESGNAWARAMMGVLLADVALWTGRCALCVDRAREAERIFADIDDTWGRIQAISPQLRALAKLGRKEDYETLRARMTPLARTLANTGMHEVPAAIHGSVLADAGNGEAALDALGQTDDKWTGLGNLERQAATALALVQTGRAPEAISQLREPYASATDDGPRAHLGGILALALATEGETGEATEILDSVDALSGGTWADRLRVEVTRACLAARAGNSDAARAMLERARDRVANTDAAVEQAVVALACAVVLEELDDDEAPAARREATRSLELLGMSADGWKRAFRAACTPGR